MKICSLYNSKEHVLELEIFQMQLTPENVKKYGKIIYYLSRGVNSIESSNVDRDNKGNTLHCHTIIWVRSERHIKKSIKDLKKLGVKTIVKNKKDSKLAAKLSKCFTGEVSTMSRNREFHYKPKADFFEVILHKTGKNYFFDVSGPILPATCYFYGYLVECLGSWGILKRNTTNTSVSLYNKKLNIDIVGKPSFSASFFLSQVNSNLSKAGLEIEKPSRKTKKVRSKVDLPLKTTTPA